MAVFLGSVYATAELDTTKWDQGLDKIEGGLTSASKGASVLGNVLTAGLATGVLAFATKSAFAAARTEELTFALHAVAKANGISAQQADYAVRALRGMNIEQQKATEITSLFIQSNLNLADALRLANTAKDLAVISGQDSSEATRTLTEAIVAQEPMLLRQFGIITGLPDAYKQYGKQLGITTVVTDKTGKSTEKLTRELTENEKQQALLRVILEQGKSAAGSYEAAMQSASKPFRTLTNRVLPEFIAQIGKAFTPALAGVVMIFTKALQVLTGFMQLNQGVTTILAITIVALSTALLLVRGVIPAVIFGVRALTTAFTGLFISLLRISIHPLVLLLTVLAAVVGFFAFKALMAASASTGLGDKLKDLGGSMGGVGDQAKEMADQTTDAIRDIDEQVRKSTRNFNEELAKIISNHRERVRSLRDEIAEEKALLAERQAEIEGRFAEEKGELEVNKEERIADLQDQLRQEQNKYGLADRVKIKMLQERIAQENAKYDQQLLKLEENRTKDLAKEKEGSTKKLTELQKSLNTELAFLRKHRSAVISSRKVQLLDEIELLRRNHAEELAQLSKQRSQVLKNAKLQSAGIVGINKKMGTDLEKIFGDIGDDMGVAMAKSFKKAFIAEITSFWNTLWDNAKFLASKEGLKFMSENVSFTWNQLTKRVKRRQVGTKFWQGGLVRVGEAGPEIVSLPRGSEITPAHNQMQPGNAVSLTVNIGTYAGTATEKRRLGMEILHAINQVRISKGIQPL